jgi:hypothetical protein
VLDTDRKELPGNVPKMEETVVGNYFEGDAGR